MRYPIRWLGAFSLIIFAAGLAPAQIVTLQGVALCSNYVKANDDDWNQATHATHFYAWDGPADIKARVDSVMAFYPDSGPTYDQTIAFQAVVDNALLYNVVRSTLTIS